MREDRGGGKGGNRGTATALRQCHNYHQHNQQQGGEEGGGGWGGGQPGASACLLVFYCFF